MDIRIRNVIKYGLIINISVILVLKIGILRMFFNEGRVKLYFGFWVEISNKMIGITSCGLVKN